MKVRSIPIKLRAAPRTQQLSAAQLSMLPPLPDMAEEVRGIAIALKADFASSAFTGVVANAEHVKTMNPRDRRVIVFATHGLEAGDLDGLTQPALALSSPIVAHSNDDGLLTIGDVMGLKLDADSVVLSACNTATGARAGADAVSGLGRAFLYTGTRAILVSNWPVETTSARLLTTELFQAQAADPTLGRAQALRHSMLALIDGKGFADASGKIVYSYAHPNFFGRRSPCWATAAADNHSSVIRARPSNFSQLVARSASGHQRPSADVLDRSDHAQQADIDRRQLQIPSVPLTDVARSDTGSECMTWMRDAGFGAARIQSLGGPHSMVVGTN